MTQKKQDPMRGVYTIPSTPFLANGAIDVPGFKNIVNFCVECGAHGLVFPVNASEFTNLSDEERLTLSKVLVEENRARIPAIIGVAGVSKEVAAKFAANAREIGADGVIAMPPYIRNNEMTDAILFDYYRAISDAARIPVHIQNYVPPVGTNMSAPLLLRLCREIEHVKYIKEETVPSTIKMSEIIANNDGSCLGVFGGSGGRYLIEEYRRGCCGNMPGCHVTDVVVSFWNALEAGNGELAMRIYKDMAPLFFFEHQLPGCYKEVLKRRGIIGCSLKRNGDMPLDPIASRYLDETLAMLKTYMKA
jgi:dihydrodipicolinate synthase/N-acetylneuraminate lyase